MTNALDGTDALAHALHYIALGWRVVPIERGYKYPRGIEGWQDLDLGTSDLHQWWGQGERNIGIICGAPSGIFALDVDPRHGGDDSLAALERLHGKLPDTVEAITGGGGRHLLFRYEPPAGAVLGNSAGQLGAGLDIRAQGGQIVVAPSVHPETGARYEWEASSRPGEVPVASAPGWLVALLTEKAAQLPVGQLGDAFFDTTFAVDHFNSVQSNETVAAYLETKGWHSRRTDRSGVVYLTRPGKDDRSVGIAIGKVAPGVAYCFTSSVAELGDARGYRPFDLYAAYEHDDDRTAADAALVAAGWGEPTFAIDHEALAEWAVGVAQEAKIANAVLNPRTGDRREVIDSLDFLASPDPEYDWLIPGLIERGERVILTAPEGGGKSTLLRQFGVMAACGMHPFGGDDFDPLVVVIVDLENGERHLRRKLRALVECSGDRLARGQLWLAHVPEGIDLTAVGDATWLEGQLASVEPDLVVIGPIYKMSEADPIEEVPSKAVAKVLDVVRHRFGCALLIEAHSPHESGGGKRPQRPYGWSGWKRWPEYGLYLAADGSLGRWRGDRDIDRAWPPGFRRGETHEWPFMPFVGRDVTYAKVLDVVRAAGKVPSVREIAAAADIPKSTVDRMIRNNKAHWEAFCELVEKGEP